MLIYILNSPQYTIKISKFFASKLKRVNIVAKLISSVGFCGTKNIFFQNIIYFIMKDIFNNKKNI